MSNWPYDNFIITEKLFMNSGPSCVASSPTGNDFGGFITSIFTEGSSKISSPSREHYISH